MDNRFALVEFQGDQLLTIFDGRTVRVAMKPLVERMGIAWPRQFQKLKEDPVLSEGVTLTVIPSERGGQETITLPIDLMQGWLFKLNPEKVAPEARERVIAYQRECYQVLHDYWVKGAAVNPRMAGASAEQTDRAARRRDLPGLMDKLRQTDHAESRRVLHALVVRACEAEGIDAPTLESFVPGPQDDHEANAALTIIDALVAGGVVRNWHRRADMIAIRRKDAEAHGVVFTDALRRHPRFVAEKSVNPKHAPGVYCWVFKRAV